MPFVSESNNPEGAIYTAEQIAAVGKGTNWQDEIFRVSAPVQNYQFIHIRWKR